jgi:Zn-dependent protease/predicted transcriptional regulator
MMGHSWKIGRIAGIDIRIDSSWIIIALLISYSLYLQFSSTYTGLNKTLVIFLAVTSSILFFGSVLAHELTHATVARRRGVPVEDITLFLFGGTTRARPEAGGPKDEFIISIVGPISSFVLAAVLGIVSLGLENVSAPVAGAFGYLGWVNVLLGTFNLAPGLPLDGGRVLRSILWGSTHSLERATRIASWVGEALGYVMVAAGLFLLFADLAIGGLWFAAIGWFLAQAARASYSDVELHQLLRRIVAADVMETDVPRIGTDTTLRQAIDEFLAHRGHEALYVGDRDQTVGVITLSEVHRFPRDQWDDHTVMEPMTVVEGDAVVAPTTSMERVLDRFEEGHIPCVVVEQRGEVVGVITTSDLARWVQRRRLAA